MLIMTTNGMTSHRLALPEMFLTLLLVMGPIIGEPKIMAMQDHKVAWLLEQSLLVLQILEKT